MSMQDDHMGGVTNTSGNVMYKAAGRSFLVNGGAGCNITHNLIMEGGLGIYNFAGDDMVTSLPLYDNGTLHRGDKADYIWKTEQNLGVPNFSAIQETLLARRYPSFGRMLSVNSTLVGWASPAASNFAENIFINNTVGNICLRTSYGTNGRFCDEALDKATAPGWLPQDKNALLSSFVNRTGNLDGEWGWFPAHEQLEFVNQSLNIDSTSAGLVCDEFRRSIPDPRQYRPFVKQTFDGIPSFAGDNSKYTPVSALHLHTNAVL
jgi:hypothetical protein